MTDLTELAIHEAGHAAAATLLGHRFSYASLYRTADAAGHVKMIPSPRLKGKRKKSDAEVQRRIETYIVMLLAGAYAVRHAANDKGQGMPWEIYGAVQDSELAWEFASMSNADISWTDLKKQARLFVALNWETIARVARALEQNKIMTSGQIQRVIEEGSK